MSATPSNKTYELGSVKAWLLTMAERGMFPLNSARLRATALEQLKNILGPEEPQEVRYLLDNLDAITARWATKTNAKPETSATYKQRAKRALEDYLQFQTDPTGFRPRVVRLVPDGATKRNPPTAQPRAASASAPPPASPGSAQQSERSYPLADGAEFTFRLPARGVTSREVQRIAWHLLTLTTDFDERNPLAIVKTDEK
jgi:hypothetical protein